jgi:ABC-type sugar transport system ATPase subunit
VFLINRIRLVRDREDSHCNGYTVGHGFLTVDLLVELTRILTECDRGAAILYISTELEEVMTMSDRIAVIYRGEFIAILDAATAQMEEIGLLMGEGENDHNSSH